MLSGEEIYQAIAAWSAQMKALHLRETLLELNNPSPDQPQAQVMADESSAALILQPIGLLTQLVFDLPALARVLLSVSMIILGLASCFIYVRALRWGSRIGKTQGDVSSRAYFASGLGGFISGAIFFPMASIFIMLVVLSRKAVIDKSPVSSAGLLAIIISTSLLGGLLSARSHYLGRGAQGLVGGFALATLLLATFQMTNQVFRTVFLVAPLILSFIFSCVVALPSLSPALASRALCPLSSLAGAWLLSCAIDFYKQLGWIDLQILFLSPNGLPSYNSATATERVVDWSNKDFKGLLAGTWLLSILGTAIQLWLYSKVGEDPDRAFNAYLHAFIDEEKGADESFNGRSGVYQPKSSFWNFWQKERRPLVQRTVFADEMEQSPLTDMPHRFKSVRHSPRPDDVKEGFQTPYDDYQHRPNSLASYASSATLVSTYQKAGRKDDVDEDEYEGSTLPQLLSQPAQNQKHSNRGGIGAAFKSMFSTSSASQPARYQGLRSPGHEASNTLSRHQVMALASQNNRPLSPSASSTLPVPGVQVEATPSLVNALSRVAAAQREARQKQQQAYQEDDLGIAMTNGTEQLSVVSANSTGIKIAAPPRELREDGHGEDSLWDKVERQSKE